MSMYLRDTTLESWFGDLWQYWLDVIHENDDLPSFVETEDTRVRLLASGSLDVLSDMADRVLVCDAIAGAARTIQRGPGRSSRATGPTSRRRSSGPGSNTKPARAN